MTKIGHGKQTAQGLVSLMANGGSVSQARRRPRLDKSRPKTPDGTIAPVYPNPRNVHRNAPCPCGSGKKFKKCHLGQSHVVPGSHTPKDPPRREGYPRND